MAVVEFDLGRVSQYSRQWCRRNGGNVRALSL